MNINDYLTIEAMEKKGGEFVKKLAAAYVAADDDNREKIRNAFSEIWEKYTPKIHDK